MSFWDAAGWLGVALNVAGVAVTMSGIADLGRELFPSAMLPHQRVWKSLKRVWRWVSQPFRGKTQSQSVGVHSIDATTITDGVTATVTRGRPAEDATEADWRAYWSLRIEDVEGLIVRLRSDLSNADRELGRRLEEEAAQRRERDLHLEDRLRNVVGGQGGRGLRKAWWGLAATLVGTVLWGFGGYFG